jgi:phosphate-transporting ATPase
MLQVRDLRTSILKPASFSLSAGEALAVRGPSGAGKTLLLRAVADLDPNEGLVTLDGRDRSTIAGPEWRRLVGYVPAEPGWWADTVGEHFGEWTATLAFVRDLGFPEETKAWPIARLSTGERLRLALVRALMLRPKVLLLDEPTAALDVASVAAVESLIKARMRTGLAVLWVTHDVEQGKRVAHRLLAVEAGQVWEEAPEWTLIWGHRTICAKSYASAGRPTRRLHRVGQLSFAARHLGDGVAPSAVIPGLAPERGSSTLSGHSAWRIN